MAEENKGFSATGNKSSETTPTGRPKRKYKPRKSKKPLSDSTSWTSPELKQAPSLPADEFYSDDSGCGTSPQSISPPVSPEQCPPNPSPTLQTNHDIPPYNPSSASIPPYNPSSVSYQSFHPDATESSASSQNFPYPQPQFSVPATVPTTSFSPVYPTPRRIEKPYDFPYQTPNDTNFQSDTLGRERLNSNAFHMHSAFKSQSPPAHRKIMCPSGEEPSLNPSKSPIADTPKDTALHYDIDERMTVSDSKIAVFTTQSGERLACPLNVLMKLNSKDVVYSQLKRELTARLAREEAKREKEDNFFRSVVQNHQNHLYLQNHENHLYLQNHENHLYLQNHENHLYLQNNENHLYLQNHENHLYLQNHPNHLSIFAKSSKSSIFAK